MDSELPDHRDAAASNVLRQIAGLVATSLKASWGEVQLRLDASRRRPVLAGLVDGLASRWRGSA